MKFAFIHISAILLLSVALFSCRGQKTDNPPIRTHTNMNFQDRFNSQEENRFFEDGRAMRTPVEGTVARGMLQHDDALFAGLDEDGNFIEEIPFDLTRNFLYRGKERFEIYCQVCHGGTGNGQGIIMTGEYGYVPAPSFHRAVSYEMPVGEYYSAITNGIRTMPSYASQIKVEDRWAIVAYIRALQKSQNVPEAEMNSFDVDLAQLEEEFRAEQERLAALAEERTAGASEEVSAERGEQLVVRNACQACHSLEGNAGVGPTFLGLYGSERNFADGSSTVANEEYLYQSITEPGARIVDGFDNAMVPYDFLSESELQSLIEFIKTLSEE